MTFLFEGMSEGDGVEPQAPKILTVSELNATIRRLLEGRIGAVWVEGEVSTLRRPQSGHYYFTLKDDKAQLRAVMFRGDATRLGFDLEHGMQVIVFGEVSVYEASGEYQIVIRKLEPKGLGALQAAFEQLKAKLAKEGLFAPERKRPLPAIPRSIGIVTSPTGAAIRDILKVILRRHSGVRIVLAPVKVQGVGAAEEIAGALDLFSAYGGVDLVIVGRGGGSLEDLWAFNEEVVARAIARCAIPVMSAVGHEIDVTIADFVADRRAATPSQAGELAVPDLADLERGLEAWARRLDHLWERRLADAQNRLAILDGRLQRQSPIARLQRFQQHVDQLDFRLQAAQRGRIERARQRVEMVSGRLHALSPLSVLDRGYSLTSLGATGEVVTDVRQLSRGDMLHTRLAKGGFKAMVESIDEEEIGL
ncbi:MAG: exodeoxyribonuclease VII large subunit [Verrucomicrobiota bacterium]|nr:exodeoxyribonuclease VII large subunit [Verrucomicrobiota bacterium]